MEFHDPTTNGAFNWSAHDANAVIKVIKAAKIRIADPKCWRQDAWAADAAGNSMSWDNQLACRWCAGGALYKEGAHPDVWMFIGHCLNMKGYSDKFYDHGVVADFNDAPGATHAGIMKLFDHAISVLGAYIVRVNAENVALTDETA